MKKPLSFAALALLAASLCAPVVQAAPPQKPAVNAPRNISMATLQASLKASLSRAADSKVALPNLEGSASNPVRPATQPSLLASASRLTDASEATTLPKTFDAPGRNFLRGAKTTKAMLSKPAKGLKTNAARARVANSLRAGVSNLRKLPFVKMP